MSLVVRGRGAVGAVLSCLSLMVAPSPARGGQLDYVPSRIVAIGPWVTEILFELGAGDRVVGVDSASTSPRAVRARPKVGYFRSLTVEGLLALDPQLILAINEAGPPEVLEQVRAAGVKLVQLPPLENVSVASEAIRKVGVAIGQEEESVRLAKRLVSRLESLQKHADRVAERPPVLLLFAPTAHTLLVAGRDTVSDLLIRFAGAQNAAESLVGLKALGAEGILASKPEWILVTEHTLRTLGGEKGLWSLPAIAGTPAAEQQRLFVGSDVGLLAPGPSFVRCAEALSHRLHGGASGSDSCAGGD